MLWCCPLHRGALIQREGVLLADCCGATFPLIAGIPDLRTGYASWMDLEDDRRRAADLESSVAAEDVAGSVRWVFGRRPGWTRAMIERRTAQVLEAVAKLHEECRSWLAPAIDRSGPVLDVGCGPGMMLAAMPGDRPRIGIDVSLEWLVVAKRLTRAAGVEASLAAGHAESLPLRDEFVGTVIALDVLEHVGDQAAMLREIDRVLMPGGVFAAATPNRYSLAAEPHVYLWGVGWLPRAWQKGYVRQRTGLSYDFTRLLSITELRNMIDSHSSLRAVIDPAPVPASDLRRFSKRRRVLGEMYNGLLAFPPFRAAARRVGPFFQITAVKPTPVAGA
jgi:2-polyprenyl-3-methyl-5-hydroxy-6-metoxy-1,4-benzoquinol methylase